MSETIKSFASFTHYVCARCGIDSDHVQDQDSFEELGVDSLSLYSLVDDVEKTFHITIDTDDITEINSIGKMYSYIQRKVENDDSRIDS
jgi:acyl carrier protein